MGLLDDIKKILDGEHPWTREECSEVYMHFHSLAGNSMGKEWKAVPVEEREHKMWMYFMEKYPDNRDKVMASTFRLRAFISFFIEHGGHLELDGIVSKKDEGFVIDAAIFEVLGRFPFNLPRLKDGAEEYVFSYPAVIAETLRIMKVEEGNEDDKRR